MNGAVENLRGWRGLSVPLLTALDAKGGFDAASQARLAQWTLQDGWGADSLFPAGTTGEWNHLSPDVMRQAVEASARGDAGRVWAGVTCGTLTETLKSLEHSLGLGLAAVVLAPLSIEGAPDPVTLMREHIAPRIENKGVALLLYDNADIAAPGAALHLKTSQLKAMARYEFVAGIKVSAGLKVTGDYLKAAGRLRSETFHVLLGNAGLCFPLFMPDQGPWTRLMREWRAFWLNQGLPHGVVSGPANLFPREWKRAWLACARGEQGLMLAYQRSFADFSVACRFGGTNKMLACLKLALTEQGVLDCSQVAPGTSALKPDEARLFLDRCRGIREGMLNFSPSGWISKLDMQGSNREMA